jgi:hypothetical protein
MRSRLVKTLLLTTGALTADDIVASGLAFDTCVAGIRTNLSF